MAQSILSLSILPYHSDLCIRVFGYQAFWVPYSRTPVPKSLMIWVSAMWGSKTLTHVLIAD